MPEQYFSKLEHFVEKCIQITKRGQPYLAVLACHELYRYLYPIEPHADFKHTDPIPFCTTHIDKLLGLLDNGSATIAPYPYVPEKSKLTHEAGLEQRTATLYSALWEDLDEHALMQESKELMSKRLPKEVIQNSIKGAHVLDMGCGSGRYTMALAHLGAASVVGVDAKKSAYARSEKICKETELPVSFQEENFLHLSFEAQTFDFVFANGTLHHSESLERALSELNRVLRPSGKSFLYLYGARGIFWDTRIALRRVFEHIPIDYARSVLRLIGMPGNRFIFCDTWYVPVEMHTSKEDLHEMLDGLELHYEKVISGNPFDIDAARASGLPGAEAMWGNGEHRYILSK